MGGSWDPNSMDIGRIEKFLSGLGKSAGDAQTAMENAPPVGDTLLNYILGSTPSSKDGFDGIVATLMSAWSGDAADAFKKQTQTVRSFGIGVAAQANKLVNTQPTGQQIPPQMQYELGSMADYAGAASTLQQVFSGAHSRYTAATSGPNSFDNWTGNLAGLLRDVASNTAPGSTTTISIPTFAEFVDGVRVSTSTDDYGNTVYGISGGKATGQLSVDYQVSGPFDPGTSHVTYQNPEYGSGFQMTIQWNAWPWENGHYDDSNHKAIHQYTLDSEFNNYLRKVMVDLGDQYSQVQSPDPQDNSVLPKTNGSSNNNGPGGPGGPGGYSGYPGFGGGSATGAGKVPGVTSGVGHGSGLPGSFGGNGLGNGGTSLAPGTVGGTGTGPGTLPGGSATSGSPLTGGGLGSTKLAGLNPGGGLAPGATGLGIPGIGVPGGGGVTGGAGFGGGGLGTGGGLAAGTAGPGGLGADSGLAGAADVAAGAGNAGRMMPMAPMAGAGAGRDKGDRQRTAFLTEDEEIWGADGGGDAVL